MAPRSKTRQEMNATLSLPKKPVPLIDFDFVLGHDAERDSPVQSAFTPNSFVPAGYESIRKTLTSWFPHANPVSPSLETIKQQVQAAQAQQDADESTRSASSPNPDATLLPSNQRRPQNIRKRKPSSKSKSVSSKDADVILLGAELVPQTVSYQDMSILDMSDQGTYVSVYNLVAFAPESVKTQEPCISLGFIVPESFCDDQHPLNKLVPTLVEKEWVSLYCEVSLQAPFFPPQDCLVGPSSSHPWGRAISYNSHNFYDPVTRHFLGSQDPTLKTPPSSLLGVLHVEIGLEPSAFKYGLDGSADGFIDSNLDLKATLAEGSFQLARALKSFLPVAVDHPQGFLQIKQSLNTYWDNPNTFYRLPPKSNKLCKGSRISTAASAIEVDLAGKIETGRATAKTKRKRATCRANERSPIYDSMQDSQMIDDERHLPLDTNMVSLLEMCRPNPQGPTKSPPPDVILTPLLKYQARCLAWMIDREARVDDENSLLLPNWVPLEVKDVDQIRQVRKQMALIRQEKFHQQQSEPLPKKRKKAATISNASKGKTKDTASGSSAYDDQDALETTREPFIDPLPFEFFFDLYSGMPSLRKFTCRDREPGGALCESMGLGKTLECLSLVASRPRPANPQLLAYDRSRSAKLIQQLDVGSRPFVSLATLVVCPAALVEQWLDEIRKHFRSPTQSTLPESEFASNNPLSQPGVFRFSESDFLWTSESSRQDVRTWASVNLVEPDVVITTYEELASQLSQSQRARNLGKEVRTPLLEVLFWRVILDEAQIVAGTSGKATQMVHELWRSNCWLVTGTPVTKGIKDLQGIFSFLDHDPFASDRMFHQILQTPFVNGEVEGIRRMRSILSRYIWRHTKVHVEDEIPLPLSTTEWLELEMKDIERLFYQRELRRHKGIFSRRAAHGTQTVTDLSFLVTLRQLLSHPQVAEQLGYGINDQRLSFDQLFAQFCEKAESELDILRMQVVTTVLQLAWGHDFFKKECDKGKWQGGKPMLSNNQLFEFLNQANVICNLALQDQQGRRDPGFEPEHEISPGHDTAEIGGKDDDENRVPSSGADPSLNMQHTDHDNQATSSRPKPGQGREAFQRLHLGWNEALYWVKVLEHQHSDTNGSSDPTAPCVSEPEGLWDPERPTKMFFEKVFASAKDDGVDLDDPRFHVIKQDAGSEDMNEDDLNQFLAANTMDEPRSDASSGTLLVQAQRRAGRPPKSSKTLLKKSRLRGNVGQRDQVRVWYYKPKEKLETIRNRLNQAISAQQSKEHEVAFLRERLSEEGKASSVGDDTNKVSGSRNECAICLDRIIEPAVLPCYHSFCYDCVTTLANNGGGRGHCPQCRSTFIRREITECVMLSPSSKKASSESGSKADGSGQDDPDTVQGDWGSKISGLILDLRQRLQQDPSHKAVIFSHWKKMLSFISDALNQNGIPAVAFTGGEHAQANALNSIRDDDDVKVILVPFRASEGAAGLTLTCCDLGYLMEPSLDAALEAQAIGRINRIGQNRPTKIIRVKMKDTIEDAVMQIAEQRSRKGIELLVQRDGTAGRTDEGDVANDEAPSETSASRTGEARTRSQTLRSKSIASSVGSSVGVARGSGTHHLSMSEVADILGFDIEEEKRILQLTMRQIDEARQQEMDRMLWD